MRKIVRARAPYSKYKSSEMGIIKGPLKCGEIKGIDPCGGFKEALCYF